MLDLILALIAVLALGIVFGYLLAVYGALLKRKRDKITIAAGMTGHPEAQPQFNPLQILLVEAFVFVWSLITALGGGEK